MGNRDESRNRDRTVRSRGALGRRGLLRRNDQFRRAGSRSRRPDRQSRRPGQSRPATGRGRLRTLALAGCLVAAVLAPQVAHAQFSIGGHGVYKSRTFDGTFGLGARAELDLGFIFNGLAVGGTWDYLFPSCEECTWSELGARLVMAPRGPLYFGLGVGVSEWDLGSVDSTDDGSDDMVYFFVAGLRLRNVPVIEPFFEYRQQFASETLNEQTLSIGITLNPLGRRNAPGLPGPF